MKPPRMDPWDFCIQDATRALVASLEALHALEPRRLPSPRWRHQATQESALALARRQVTLDQHALRGARLRALNGRIERIRRDAPGDGETPFTPDLFAILRESPL